MKRIPVLIGLALVIVLAACGPQEPLITKPAQEMNLAAEDVEAGASLQEEVGLKDLLARVKLDEPGTATDANLRTFLVGTADVSATAEAGGTQLIAAVVVFNSSGSAQGAVGEIQQSTADALKKDSPDLALMPLTIQIGDQNYFGGAELAGQAARIYLLVFRKANVVGMLMAAGPVGTLSEEWVRTIAQKMAGKVPLPTANP